MRQSRSDQSLA